MRQLWVSHDDQLFQLWFLPVSQHPEADSMSRRPRRVRESGREVNLTLSDVIVHHHRTRSQQLVSRGGGRFMGGATTGAAPLPPNHTVIKRRLRMRMRSASHFWQVANFKER